MALAHFLNFDQEQLFKLLILVPPYTFTQADIECSNICYEGEEADGQNKITLTALQLDYINDMAQHQMLTMEEKLKILLKHHRGSLSQEAASDSEIKSKVATLFKDAEVKLTLNRIDFVTSLKSIELKKACMETLTDQEVFELLSGYIDDDLNLTVDLLQLCSDKVKAGVLKQYKVSNSTEKFERITAKMLYNQTKKRDEQPMHFLGNVKEQIQKNIHAEPLSDYGPFLQCVPILTKPGYFVTYQEPPYERFDKHCLFAESRSREIISVDGCTLKSLETRNYYDKPKGLVSIFKHFDDVGFQCVHSFVTANLIPILRNSRSNSKPMYLLSGHSDHIYWFTKPDISVEENSYTLQILNEEAMALETYPVVDDSELYKRLTNEKQFETQQPNLVSFAEDILVLIFANFDGSIYVYDLKVGTILVEITGQACPKFFLFCERNEDTIRLVIQSYLDNKDRYSQKGTETWIQEELSLDYYRQLQVRGNHRHKIKTVRMEDLGVVKKEKIVQRCVQKHQFKIVPEIFPLTNDRKVWAQIPRTMNPGVGQETILTKVYQTGHQANVESHGTDIFCRWQRRANEVFFVKSSPSGVSNFIVYVNDTKSGKSLSFHDPLTGQFVDEVLVPTGVQVAQIELQRPTLIQVNKVKTLYGSFIDKTSGAISWFKTQLGVEGNRLKLSDLQQLESNKIVFGVQFPLVYHTFPNQGQFKLEVTHMTDKETPTKILNFTESTFLTSVECQTPAARSQISFLSIDLKASKPYLTQLQWIRPFEKTTKEADTKLEVVQTPFKGFDDFLRKARDLKKCFLLDSPQVSAVLFQTSTSMFIIKEGRKCVNIFKNASIDTEGDAEHVFKMKPIESIKQDERNYLVVCHEQSIKQDALLELSIKHEVQDQWEVKQKAIYWSSNAAILAIDTDKNAFSYHQEAYILDSKGVVTKLQKFQNSYVQRLKVAITSKFDEFQQELSFLQTKPFRTACLGERTVTINGRVYSCETGEQTIMKIKLLPERTRICEQRKVAGAPLDVHLAFRKRQDGQLYDNVAIVVKNRVTSREMALLSEKAASEVLLCGFISDELFLLKMFEQEEIKWHEQVFYWTIISAQGQVQPIPSHLKKLLMSQDWKFLQTKGSCGDSKTQLILKSDTSVAIVLFNSEGEVVGTQVFHSDTRSFKSLKILNDFVSPLITSETISSRGSHIFYIGNGEMARSDNASLLLSVTLDEQQNHSANDPFSACVSYQESQTGGQFKLTTLIFRRTQKYLTSDKNRDCTQFAITQNFVCMKDPNWLDINCFNIDVLVPEVNPLAGSGPLVGGETLVTCSPTHTISLHILVQDMLVDDPMVVLTECSQLFSVYEESKKLVDFDAHRKEGDFIQVTIGSRLIVYDLASTSQSTTKKKRVPALYDIPSITHLMHPELYLETAFRQTEPYMRKRCIDWGTSREKYIKLPQKGEMVPCPGSGTYFYKQESTLLSNGERDKHYEHRPFKGLYRTYSEYDLQEVMKLAHQLSNSQKVKQIDVKTLFCTIEKQSVFSLFTREQQLLQQILLRLEAEEYGVVEDQDEREIAHQDLHRLVQMLSLKDSSLSGTTSDTELDQMTTQTLLPSTMQRSLQMSHVQARDLFVQIANICPNESLFNFIPNQGSAECLLRTTTPVITESFKDCFQETKSTQLISTVDWPQDQSTVTFRSNSCLLTQKECQKRIKSKFGEGSEYISSTVTVRMLPLDWLFSGKLAFPDIIRVLIKSNNNAIFESELVANLLTEFWDENFWKLFAQLVVPFSVYLVFAMAFLLTALDPHQEDPESRKQAATTSLGIISLFLWFYQVAQEVRQLLNCDTWRAYWLNIWNLADLVHLFLLVTLIISNFNESLRMAYDTQRVIGALCSTALLLKAYDWLRMFEQTAFYILLITETIKDIKFFLILFLISLMMFGFPMMLLNFNRGDDNAVMNEVSGVPALDAVLGQYAQSLAGYETEAFAGEPQTAFCVMFFILATLFTQITMLNMLIAIMGDTFERIVENKAVFATKTKLELLGENTFCLGRHKNAPVDKDVFLYVVAPVTDDTNDFEQWHGSVKRVHKLIQRDLENISEKMGSKVDRLSEKAEKQESLVHQLEQNVTKIDKTVGNLAHQLHDLKSHITEVLDTFKSNKLTLNGQRGAGLVRRTRTL